MESKETAEQPVFGSYMYRITDPKRESYLVQVLVQDARGKQITTYPFRYKDAALAKATELCDNSSSIEVQILSVIAYSVSQLKLIQVE